MGDIAIIDSHHHLYDRAKNASPMLESGAIVHEKLMGESSALLNDYLIADYMADCTPHGVNKSVHLESDWVAADTVNQTRWLQGLADAHGFPHGIVGYADLAAPDIQAVIEGHMQYANFRGIRQMLFWHDDPDLRMAESADQMDDPDWRRGYLMLGQLGLTFDHGINYAQLPMVAALIREMPEVACVINHVGYPSDRTPEAVEVWRKGIAEVAACHSARMKMSGIFMTDHDWTVQSIRPFVLETIEAFGPARCMFGSNFPVDKLYGGYAEILGAYQEVVKDFSESERRQLFHDTAASFYRV